MLPCICRVDVSGLVRRNNQTTFGLVGVSAVYRSCLGLPAAQLLENLGPWDMTAPPPITNITPPAGKRGLGTTVQAVRS